MRKMVGATLVALLFFSLAPTSTLAGKRTVPDRVLQARHIALGYDLGDRFVAEDAPAASPDVLPEERRVLQVIRDEVRRWGMYVLTARPGDAELLIAVRLGRPADLGAGAGGSGYLGGPGGMRRGSSYGGEVSSSDDRLTVYDCVEGRVGKRLWRSGKSGGLVGAPPALFTEFRTDVERTGEAAKQETAKE
jgi:hypothetical protein